MPVFVTCPSCAVKLAVPEDLLGKKVKCASCSTIFEAKAEPAAAADDESGGIYALAPPPEQRPDRPRPPLEDDSDEGEDDYHYEREDGPSRRHIRRDITPHRGGLVMGLGIASCTIGAMGFCCWPLVVFGIPLGTIAWILGQNDLSQIDKGTMDPDGRGQSKAGRICGIVGCSLAGLNLLCCLGQTLLRLTLMHNMNNKWF